MEGGRLMVVRDVQEAKVPVEIEVIELGNLMDDSEEHL